MLIDWIKRSSTISCVTITYVAAAPTAVRYFSPFAILSEFFAPSTKHYQAWTCVSSSVSIRTAKAGTLFYSAGRESVIGSGSASLSSALNVNGLILFPDIYAGMLLFVDDLRRVSHYERLTPHYETYTCTRIIGPRYKEHLSFSLLLSVLFRCDITFYISPRLLAAHFAVFFVLFFSVSPSSRFFKSLAHSW